MRREAVAIAICLLTATAAPAAALLAIDALSAPTAVYHLPWAAGPDSAERVLQGNHVIDAFGVCQSGCGTHSDRSQWYAWDFDLPEGTPVLAARAGAVSLVDDNWPADHCGSLRVGSDSGVGGAPSNIGNEANFVEIDQGDGTSALYLHLSRVDPAVLADARTGQPVRAGDRLGWSGRTGNTGCHPHLHFQVEYTVPADWFTYSLPVVFADADVLRHDPSGIPQEGATYISDNQPTSAAIGRPQAP